MKARQIRGENDTITIVATEAITAKRFVTVDGKHTADSPCAGVALFDTDSGDNISVGCGPIEAVEASGVISAGGAVSMDADGKATALTISAVADVSKLCGRALDAAAADGDIIRVRLSIV